MTAFSVQNLNLYYGDFQALKASLWRSRRGKSPP